jgi:ribonucleoside-triphosphate reductase
MRLMEGGGVGANYSSRASWSFTALRAELNVHIVCDPEHPDYAEMLKAGVLSTEFDSDWHGAFPVEDSREGWAAAMVDLLDTYMTDDDVKHEPRLRREPGARKGSAAEDVRRHRQLAPAVRPDDANHRRRAERRRFDAPDPSARPVAGRGNGDRPRHRRVRRLRWRPPLCPHGDLPLGRPVHRGLPDCKADGSKHWTTNISVEIDDEFINAAWPTTGDCTRARGIPRAVVRGC